MRQRRAARATPRTLGPGPSCTISARTLGRQWTWPLSSPQWCARWRRASLPLQAPALSPCSGCRPTRARTTTAATAPCAPKLGPTCPGMLGSPRPRPLGQGRSIQKYRRLAVVGGNVSSLYVFCRCSESQMLLARLPPSCTTGSLRDRGQCHCLLPYARANLPRAMPAVPLAWQGCIKMNDFLAFSSWGNLGRGLLFSSVPRRGPSAIGLARGLSAGGGGGLPTWPPPSRAPGRVVVPACYFLPLPPPLRLPWLISFLSSAISSLQSRPSARASS